MIEYEDVLLFRIRPVSVDVAMPDADEGEPDGGPYPESPQDQIPSADRPQEGGQHDEGKDHDHHGQEDQ